MALVRKLEKMELQTHKVHGEVACTYTSFRADSGKLYFQIDTYGSPDRKYKGKKSQTIQLDQEAATALVTLVKTAFSIG